MSSNSVLYVFIDEGGNLDFSDKGTAYFTLSAMLREGPGTALDDFLSIKYDLLKNNVPIEYFHASEDTYETRKVVFEAIGKLKADFKLVLYSIEKSTYIIMHLMN